MKPFWAIQEIKRIDESNIQRLIYAVQERGMDVSVFNYVPFDGMDWSFLPANRPVIVQGAISVVKNAQRRSKAYPLAWCDWEQLECHCYYAHLGKYLVQQEYGFYPFGEIPRLRNYLFSQYGKDGQIFIKPDKNEKEFTGVLAYEKDFDAWWGRINVYDIPADSLVVVSRPRNIEIEWRFVVLDGKVVVGSQYMENGRLCIDKGYPAGAAEFAEEVFKTWSPHPILVVDVGYVDGYCLVEIGGINCAGYYKHEIGALVDAMSALAERDYCQRSIPSSQ